ncbi:MAG: DNA repair protein RadA [Deltaproteobacteria bacterium]|nr:DNA repair protein RadA [Deltaproteobacteria bacterium]
MAAPKTIFACQECGATSPKWFGRCPDCGTWGSVAEQPHRPVEKRNILSPAAEPVPISRIPEDAVERLSTGSAELDRVLGGGIVPGSAILLGGDPGIGKSTLLLQTMSALSGNGKKVLYATAEESAKQIGIRARRVSAESDNLLVLAENSFPSVLEAIRSTAPDAVVLDSVQTLYHPDIPSSAGSITQVREIASQAVTLAKSQEIAVWIVGHVTKDGAIAGPRVLEHLVDTVLYFEGDASHSFRILRAVKNRFGSTNEIALLEMTGQGLVEVADPSSLFLPSPGRHSSGSAAVMGIEGTRPIMVEIQALTAPSPFANPRRTVTGADMSRVLLILAVLERKAGIQTGGLDVFVNVAGGLRLTEPAADLGIALAMVSSMRERSIRPRTGVSGELGLAGEVRPVPRLEGRLREAARLGMERAIVSSSGLDHLPRVDGIEIIPVRNIEDALDTAFD